MVLVSLGCIIVQCGVNFAGDLWLFNFKTDKTIRAWIAVDDENPISRICELLEENKKIKGAMKKPTLRDYFRPHIREVVQQNKDKTENEIKKAVREQVKSRFYLDTRHAKQTYYSELKIQIRHRFGISKEEADKNQTKLF